MKAILIVTGASRGLGLHVAQRASETGYRVIGLARNADVETPFELRPCDVSDPHQVQETLADLRRDQHVYGLVNAAGKAAMNLVLTMPLETARSLVEVNLMGTIYCCQVVGRMLVRNGGGRIINFSSIAVPLALAGEAAYAASKAGVETFSRAFAREVSGHGVTVNTVSPGPVATRMTEQLDPDQLEILVQRQVVGRPATPEDIWDIVEFLLSPNAGMTSGEVMSVGGV